MKNRTLIAVEQQITAMGCEVYEIGLYKPHTPGTESREPEMLPRTWDRATLIKSVPWLRYQNSQGRNIYIRPKGEHHLSMVDDLTTDAIRRMKAEGYSPALVVETSPGNFQAWLNHGRVLSQRLSTLAARALAEKFGGDKGAADWRHFGRLAGFTNRKQKYRTASGAFPFVRIGSPHPQREYTKASSFISELSHRTADDRTGPSEVRTYRPIGRLKTIDEFRNSAVYGGDGNRIDLAYAIYSFSHGVCESKIENDIRSRDLSKKGSLESQNRYLKRTLEKALRFSSFDLGR